MFLFLIGGIVGYFVCYIYNKTEIKRLNNKIERLKRTYQ